MTIFQNIWSRGKTFFEIEKQKTKKKQFGCICKIINWTQTKFVAVANPSVVLKEISMAEVETYTNTIPEHCIKLT